MQVGHKIEHSVSRIGVFGTNLTKAEVGFDNNGSSIFIRVTKLDGSFVGVTFGREGTISYW